MLYYDLTFCDSGGSSCDEGQWQCNDGGCITEGWLCDGTEDCDDNSDESESTCGGGQYSLLRIANNKLSSSSNHFCSIQFGVFLISDCNVIRVVCLIVWRDRVIRSSPVTGHIRCALLVNQSK